MSSPDDQRFAGERAQGGRTLHLPWAVGLAFALVVVAAAVATASFASDVGDLGRDARARVAEGGLDDLSAGTRCVGWPPAITPSEAPGSQPATVVLWGERDRFHLRNDSQEPVSVDVTADGGSVEREGQPGATAGEPAHFDLDPGAEGMFVVECGAVRMTLVAKRSTDDPPPPFRIGPNEVATTLVVTKLPER